MSLRAVNAVIPQWRNSVFVASSLFALSLLAGCGSGDKGAETPGPDKPKADAMAPKEGAGGKKLKLAFVTNNSSDFWTIARKGVEKAASELDGVEAEFRMPTDGQGATQRALVDDMVTKGLDGMAISPSDPKNQTDMLNNVAKKMLLVTQDSDAPKSDRACYIGTDNVAAGRQAGEEIKKALPNGGKVVAFVGTKDAQNAAERLQGITEALKGSKCELIDVRTDGTDRAKAKSNVADVLTRQNDIACLVGIWSYNAPAIYGAVQDAKMVGKVQIVAFDEEDDTLAGLKAGAIAATIVQQPYEFGYQAIKKMAAYIRGDKSVFPSSKVNVVETRVITKDTVDEFKKNLDKLRGR